MREHGTRRRRIALVISLSWLAALVGLPALHEAHHDAHHTHASSGAIVHQHDAQGRHVSVPRTPRSKPRARLAIDHPIEAGHQAGGVAHHAVAVLQALPPELPPVDQRVARVAPAVPSSPLVTRATPQAARGPPSNA